MGGTVTALAAVDRTLLIAVGMFFCWSAINEAALKTRRWPPEQGVPF